MQRDVATREGEREGEGEVARRELQRKRHPIQRTPATHRSHDSVQYRYSCLGLSSSLGLTEDFPLSFLLLLLLSEEHPPLETITSPLPTGNMRCVDETASGCLEVPLHYLGRSLI